VNNRLATVIQDGNNRRIVPDGSLMVFAYFRSSDFVDDPDGFIQFWKYYCNKADQNNFKKEALNWYQAHAEEGKSIEFSTRNRAD